MTITRELPQFSDLPPEKQTAEALSAMWDDPPVLLMELSDLEREVGKTRGVYGCSWPTVNTELALKNGRSSCQWLTREPDWRRAHYPGSRIELVEMTPVLVTESDGKEYYKHARWIVEVVGEREEKQVHQARLAVRLAAQHRAEVAG